MSGILDLSLKSLTGISADFMVLVLAALVVILIIVCCVLAGRSRKLRSAYEKFMRGHDGQSLEGVLKSQLDHLDQVRMEEKQAENKVHEIMDEFDDTYQKMGLVKYDAFDEMGGKLSFSLAMLNRKNTGFVLNAVHSKEGCYTYIKEIIEGNSVLLLAQEEKEAVEMAMHSQE